MMKKEQAFSAFSAYADQTLKLSRGTIDDYCTYLRKMTATPIGMRAFQRLYATKDLVAEGCYADEMLNNLPTSTARHYISNNKSAINAFLKFKHRASVPELWDEYSKDTETPWIKYDPIVPQSKRVKKLCFALEEEYARIRAFAKSILADVLDPEWFAYVPVLLTYNEDERVYQLHPREEDHQEVSDTLLSEEDEEILRSGYYRYRLLGSFNPARTAPIELYFRNTTADSFDAYLATLKNCLAHEYMHYLHHRLCEKLGNLDTYRDKGIAEGVADYFAFAYSICRGNAEDFLVALRRYIFWATYFNRGVPYAKALYFCPEKGNVYLYPGRFNALETENGTLKLTQVLKHCNNKLDATLSMWDKILP